MPVPLPSAHNPFRVLLVEDDDNDAEVVKKHLAGPGGGGGEFELICVTTLGLALAALAEDSLDIVLLDLTLPDSVSTIDTLRAVCDVCHDDKPIVLVLTGLDDQEVAKEAIQDCAQDYLIKDEMTAKSLLRALRMAINRHGILRVGEIAAKTEPGPRDSAEVHQILARANKDAVLAGKPVATDVPIHNDPSLGDPMVAARTAGDLTTASRAVEAILSDLGGKVDNVIVNQRTISDQQRSIRGALAELQVQSRRLEKENKDRDIDREKLRAMIRALRTRMRPLQSLMDGDGKPGLNTRLATIEAVVSGFNQQLDARKKTARDIMIQLIPVSATAIGTAIFGAVGWYITQRLKGTH